jgi:adenylate cyclase
MKLRAASILSLVLLALAIAIKAAEPPFILQLEHQVFDAYQQLRPRPYQPAPVRIIDIDDESLRQLGQWPWPRTLLAKMVHRLHKAGAAAIVFDAVFAEPDRTSPKEMLKIWGNGEALARVLAALPDPDAAFVESLAHSSAVMGFVLTHNQHTHLPETKAGIAVAGEDVRPFAPSFNGAVSSLAELEQASAGNGALNSDPESDGIMRRVPLFFHLRGKLYPSLAMEALRVAQGASTYILKTATASGQKGNGHGFDAVRVGAVSIPTDPEGELWLYFTRPAPERYISARRVLDDRADLHAVSGAIVLIGTSAAGLKDIRSTPLDPAAAGVEVHAQAIEQALLGISLSRPDWIRGAEICLMTLAAGLMIMASRLLKPFWSAVLMLGLAAAAVAVSWYAFSAYHLLVEPITSLLAVGMVYFSESLGRYMHGERERNQIRHAFSHYMAPALVEDLARHPEKLKLGGESRTLSVMFCDVRGFTSISEQMNPVELTSFVNRLFTPLTDVILRHQGTIDKYIGDCIMTFWNAPVDDSRHAQHAAEAALAMQQALHTLNAVRRQEAQKSGQAFIPIRIGIGINTGECSVGNMGSDQRFNFSALGDEVNLAARLESLSKYYGLDILLGGSTAEKLTSLALLEVDFLRVQGKQNARYIHALLGNESMAKDQRFMELSGVHGEMLAAYRGQRWDEAGELIERCRQRADAFLPATLDILYDHYSLRCIIFKQTPPGPSWDCVYEPAVK